MTHVAPLPREAITDPELLDLIAQGEALGVPDSLFPEFSRVRRRWRSRCCVLC